MIEKRKLAVVVTRLTGVLSFVLSFFGLMGFAFTPPWEGTPARIQMVAGILIGASLLAALPAFLLFLRRPGLAILLQWSAVIACFASVDVQQWGRSRGVIANLCAAFSPEEAVFVYPLLPAVLLTILYWFKRTSDATSRQ